jgi:hypothetical protein
LFLLQTFKFKPDWRSDCQVEQSVPNHKHESTSSAEIANKDVGKFEPLLRPTSFPLRCNHGRNRRRGVFRGASSNAISDDEDLKDVIQESLD